MSTNSTITVKIKEDKYMSIYCHYDGYPSHNGQLLLDNYNTLDKATALVMLGDLSVLAASTECPSGHTFETPIKGYTIAYGRDRGETDSAAVTGFSLYHTHINGQREQAYNYVFEDGKWTVNGHDLAEVLASPYLES